MGSGGEAQTMVTLTLLCCIITTACTVQMVPALNDADHCEEMSFEGRTADKICNDCAFHLGCCSIKKHDDRAGRGRGAFYWAGLAAGLINGIGWWCVPLNSRTICHFGTEFNSSRRGL
jgi:hypothetical protein